MLKVLILPQNFFAESFKIFEPQMDTNFPIGKMSDSSKLSRKRMPTAPAPSIHATDVTVFLQCNGRKFAQVARILARLRPSVS